VVELESGSTLAVATVEDYGQVSPVDQSNVARVEEASCSLWTRVFLHMISKQQPDSQVCSRAAVKPEPWTRRMRRRFC